MSSTQDPTAPGVTSPTATNGGRRARDHITDDQAPAEALKEIGRRFSELREYVSYFVSAKLDGLKVTGRNLGLYAAIGVLAGIAGAAFITTSVVLLCVGIALALASLFNSYWAGALVAGALFLSIVALGVIVGMRLLTRSSRERTAKKYAARQQQERVKFGTDVHQRAQDPAE